MALRRLASHLNDIIKLYRSGSSAASIARKYGVTVTTVTTELRKVGVMPLVKRGERSPESQSDAVVALQWFHEGVYPSHIARRLNRDKGWLYNVLREGGVELRGHSTQKPTHEQLILAAKSREDAGESIARPTELFYGNLLKNAGYEIKYQIAVGTGNVDLLIPSASVAVEVCCRGTFNLYRANGWLEKRIRELGERGWHTYILGTVDAQTAIADSTTDIFYWLEFLGRQPTNRRQYRVVWRNSHLVACGCSDDEHFSFVMPLEYAIDAANRINSGAA